MKVLLNPEVEDMLLSPKNRILFAHVGKCGGSAASIFLHRVLDDNYILFEMHVQDADKKISEISKSHPDDFIFLIARRDPITRFVSAFNWDKHNLFLKGAIKSGDINALYEEFPTVEAVALGLISTDPETKRRAKKFSRFAHMGMGQSFYTPLDVLERIPSESMHVFDMETLEKDLHDIVEALTGERPDLPIQDVDSKAGVRIKANYKSQYEDAATLFPTHLSQEAKAALKTNLADDFAVYNRLGNT
ncbi:sulfotransferase family 2 domain-containing protein [Phaeobacter marinintestinus]|uniref:sulfotransferase family 2 domain-containing protein n=1 Tax=Falsiphaeobacter marinintestinus TaxID=1492905 RepID=UPI0011B78FC0|nr:sulfotransferase family 2 domain-containing protein [Phaeobacter marinintestinus]